MQDATYAALRATYAAAVAAGCRSIWGATAPHRFAALAALRAALAAMPDAAYEGSPFISDPRQDAQDRPMAWAPAILADTCEEVPA